MVKRREDISQQPATGGITLSARHLLLLVAFIEGAAVMAVELAGAKMIAPFWGTSLYVWASVLAVTLGGLTIGYYTGGWATTRMQPGRLLFWELLLASVFAALMPLAGMKFMPQTMDMGVRAGSLFSAIVCIGPTLMALGMVSPTIIQLTNDSLQNTGKSSGSVYAVSTLGGIIMTLMTGFYLLPELGIKKTMYLTAGLLVLSVLIFLFTTVIKSNR